MKVAEVGRSLDDLGDLSDPGVLGIRGVRGVLGDLGEQGDQGDQDSLQEQAVDRYTSLDSYRVVMGTFLDQVHNYLMLMTLIHMILLIALEFQIVDNYHENHCPLFQEKEPPLIFYHRGVESVMDQV